MDAAPWCGYPGFAEEPGRKKSGMRTHNVGLVELAFGHPVLWLHLGGVGRDLSDEKPKRGIAAALPNDKCGMAAVLAVDLCTSNRED